MYINKQEFIDLYLNRELMVYVHNQEEKTHAANIIAGITGISDKDIARYDESHPFIGMRLEVNCSGSYGVKGKSHIIVDYGELIAMAEEAENEPDSDAILCLL